MGRKERQRQDSRERRRGNSIKRRSNKGRRYEYSGRKSSQSRGRIHKSYGNKRIVTSKIKTRIRGEQIKDQRQTSGRKRRIKTSSLVADNNIERKREDIRTKLAGPEIKDSSEVSLILGVNIEEAKHYLKEATGNNNRLKRCLKWVDKAFQSKTTKALQANLINAMTETDFVHNTIDILKQYFESQEDISNLEAVCALLRIMIRVCELNPSPLNFIHGRFAGIQELVTIIRNSTAYKFDLTSTCIPLTESTATKSTEAENSMETENDLLQCVCVPAYREAKGENFDQRSHIDLGENEVSPKQHFLTEGYNLTEKSNTSFANLEQLFAELDEIVKFCSLRSRKIMQHKQSEENSDENFRDIPIHPRLGDLNGDIEPNLRVHKAKVSYRNVDDYLDVQFRLLREDFIEPLREGIKSFTGQALDTNKKKIQEINVYENTQILSAFCGNGVNYILSFDITKLRHVHWNTTKRLKYGSLVCLSSDNFQTCYFAAVVDNEAKFRRQGRLHVQFFKHSADLQNQIQSLVGSTFTMIESTAYFEPYRPVLSSIQAITEVDLPFKEYIIRCKKDVLPPKYLLRGDSERTLDLRCLVDPDFIITSTRRMFPYHEGDLFEPTIDFNEDLNGLKAVDILSSKLPMEYQFDLDSSQLEALKTALTREISVIQGPPGCGKTHLALKIAKVLLFNRRKWQHEDGTRAQILVVCCTNHALDQFMEGICSFFKGDIVRVGNRCSNETMKMYNCKAIKSEFRKLKSFPSDIRHGFYDAKKDVDDLKRQFNLEAEKIKILRENIIHEKSLCDEMGIDYYKQFIWLQKQFEDLPPRPEFLGNSSIVEWLGIVDMVQEIQKEDTQSKDQSFENLLDNEQNIENREAMTTINFNSTEHLSESQRRELTAFKTENTSLDFDEINKLKDLTDNTNRKIIGKERIKLTNRLQHNLRRLKPMPESEAVSVCDILSTRFTYEQRWALYLYWIHTKCNNISESIAEKLELYEEADARLKEVYMMEERIVFKKADIIAMTITGAAIHKPALQETKPVIMIVEEAAEVLESHLISNLTSGCEQLIMIGDHKQLKPKPNNHRLVRKYNLDLSLFERMIQNGIKFDCLKIQHRMRPEIAENVRHFYRTLLDHESVKHFESVSGIVHNMFFIDHCVEEIEIKELKSYRNVHEVQFLIALCKYLLQQGYNASDITILTTYRGQMCLMTKIMFEQKGVLNGVRTTTVDNYQGEENEIILLSLVRSNKERQIGYLARDDRVCVALSRAKKGLYIIGNSTCLSSASDMWKTILNNMRKKGLVGKALQLRCQNHKEDAGIIAKRSGDFALGGGCRKRCDRPLDCGHACGRLCHIINREHTGMICEKPCARKCRNGHPCKKKCGEECYCEENIILTLPDCGHIIQIGCSVDLKRHTCNRTCNKTLNCGHVCRRLCQDPCVCMEQICVNLPCGHDEIIPCSVDPVTHKCTKNVEVLGTDCGHTGTVKCRDRSKHTICNSICELPLDCGHLCKNICGGMVRDIELNDRQEISKCSKGHISYCKISCKTKLKCGHTCKGLCCKCFKGRWHTLCKENCSCNLVCGHNCKGKCGYCLPCNEECMRKCSHRVCRKQCIDECMPCKSKCNWKCKHFNCTQQCGENCDRPRCNKPCKKLLKCQHECIGMCGDPCPILCRICDKKIVTSINFGAENLRDSRFVQLQDCGHLIRYDIMDVYMDIDEGTCLKRCPLCKEPIHTTNGNRYESTVNDIYIKINSFKRLIRQYDASSFTLMKSVFKHETQLLDLKFATSCSSASRCYSLSNSISRSVEPSLHRDFIECHDAVNALNQLAIFSFLNFVLTSCSTDKEVLFHGASFCLSSVQHFYEIEREIKRILDSRQLEKIEQKYLARGYGCNESREVMKNANKVLLKQGLYSEEDRKSFQKYLHMFQKEDIDTELINLSIESVSFDRDTILEEGFIDYETNYAEEFSFKVSEHQLIKTQSKTLEQSNSNTYAHDQKPVIEQEKVELSENEISVMDLFGNKTEGKMKIDRCISKGTRFYVQKIEDREIEIIDDNDMQENCLEITKIENKNNINEERLKTDRTSVKEETEHGLSEESTPTSSNKKPENPKESLFFGKESDVLMKTHSNTDTAKSRHSKGQTYVIKQFTWPDVPYFHSVQSVFHFKKIQEHCIQNSIRKETKTSTMLAFNNKKRMNIETNETEPAKKKMKDDSKSKQTFSPNNTGARKVIITGSKLISDRTTAKEHKTKQRSPFVIQKISEFRFHRDTTSSSRQEADYGNIDMNEDNLPDFEYNSIKEREKASSHLDRRTKEQNIHSAQDLRYLINKKKQFKSKLDTNDATKNNDRLRKHVQTRMEEDGKHNYCDTRGKQNTTREDNRECDSSGMRKRTPKSQNDLRHVLNKKDCKQSSESLEADELQIEGDAWKILDTI